MRDFFGPDGLLATRLSAYQFRAGQLAMAEAVSQLLGVSETTSGEQAACLVIEAETGLGKTLAYLVPAIQSGQRVVVSTNTRNLQDQILQREIPLVKALLAPDLKVMGVKGRQNYLCRYRWRQLQAGGLAGVLSGGEEQTIEQWLTTTSYAERSEQTWITADSPLWQKICCQSHTCLGGDCPEAVGCFLNRLRRDAANCQVLIVNHHLLFSDLAVRQTGFGEVLPRYETVILDEAHHVENVATTFFGSTLSRHQFLDLSGDLARNAQGDLPAANRDSLMAAAGRIERAAERLANAFPAHRGRYFLNELLGTTPELGPLLTEAGAALEHAAHCLDTFATNDGAWAQYAHRARELLERLEIITAEQFDDLPPEEVQFTYWYERTERNLTLYATPINVAAALQTSLLAQVRHCVFTSATLTTGGNFRYFLERMGLPSDTPTLSLRSPFDYAGRTLIFIPENSFPEPANPGTLPAQHQCMQELIALARGRTLGLFTSLAAMEQAKQALSERLPYPLLVQGEAPRRVLLQRFCRETESVLLAVASFWEGVDVPGDALSLVIIDKLPFEVPTDPVIMARIHRLKALGGNPFTDYQVPRAILTLRQGVGRLMRTAEDRGVIAILDVRVFTKGYGRQFRNSLPPSPVCRDLATVADFFKNQCPSRLDGAA